jgi:hypothetical protein
MACWCFDARWSSAFSDRVVSELPKSINIVLNSKNVQLPSNSSSRSLEFDVVLALSSTASSQKIEAEAATKEGWVTAPDQV